MADPAAIKCQTATLTWNSIAVGGIDSLAISGGGVGEIDTTTVASTVQTAVAGLFKPGDLTVKFSLRNQDDVGQVAMWADMLAGTVRTCVITLATSTANVITFQAFVKNMPVNADKMSVFRGEAVLCIVDTPVWS